MLVAVLGNKGDVLGIFFLILGFVGKIRHEKKSAQLIDQLESFVGICSYCNKYRTEDNEWLPIEKYIKDNTGRKLTHGICPECNAKVRAAYFGKEHSR